MGSVNDHIAAAISGSGSINDKLIAYFNSIYNIPASPTGATAATFDRRSRTDNISLLASARLHLVAIALSAGQEIDAITFVSATTAAITPTNQWFALYTYSATAPALLAVTEDDTNAAWGANTAKTLDLASSYTVTTSGIYYLGICVVAATVPSFIGTVQTGAAATGIAPILSGTSTTTLTDPASAPNPALAPTASAVLPYAYVS